jgi:hypothetical protein
MGDKPIDKASLIACIRPGLRRSQCDKLVKQYTKRRNALLKRGNLSKVEEQALDWHFKALVALNIRIMKLEDDAAAKHMKEQEEFDRLLQTNDWALIYLASPKNKVIFDYLHEETRKLFDEAEPEKKEIINRYSWAWTGMVTKKKDPGMSKTKFVELALSGDEDAVMAWVNNGFAGLSLSEYLQKMSSDE